MRSEAQKKDQATKKRKQREQERLASTDNGRDATRLSRLSIDQIDALYQQTDDFVINTHGLSMQHSEYWCNEAEGPKLVTGYPVPVQLPRALRNQNTLFKPSTTFMQGAVVLAYHGEFAADAKMHCSHLCHNPACIRVDHLTWESGPSNEKRKNCAGFVACDCGCVKQICTHFPTCKKMK